MTSDFLVPRLPQEGIQGSRLSEVMLLIIAIVGTTVAPWQLFFQQSYVIDKRISPARRSLRNTWRMPPLAEHPPRQLTTLNQVCLLVLRAHVIVAAGLVLLRILTLATGGT